MGHQGNEGTSDNIASIKIFSLVLLFIVIALGLYLLITYTFTDYYIYKARFDNRGITVGEFCDEHTKNLTSNVMLTRQDSALGSRLSSSGNIASGEPYVMLFIGASNVMTGIDSTLMEQYLDEISNDAAGSAFSGHVTDGMGASGRKYEVYNLAIGGSDPIIQSMYVDCYVRLHPSLVVYGVNSYNFGGYRSNIDYYALLSGYWHLGKDDMRRSFLSEEELRVVNYNFLQNAFYKRKYLAEFSYNFFLRPIFTKENSMLRNVLDNLRSRNDNDDNGGSSAESQAGILAGVQAGAKARVRADADSDTISDAINSDTINIGISDGFRGLKNPYPTNLRNRTISEMEADIVAPNALVSLAQLNNFSSFNNTELAAFEYIASEFERNGIDFVVFNYPLYPVLLDHIDLPREAIFTSYMNDDAKRLGFEYYDMEYLYDDMKYHGYFADTVHMTMLGQRNFTMRFADELLQRGGVPG